MAEAEGNPPTADETRRARAVRRYALLAVVAAAAGLLLCGLGRIDLWAPDEPRYAQVAEELRRSPNGAADLVVLRLHGEVYTQKPPLYYWLAAAAGSLGGRVDELSARLPSALAGVLVIALTGIFGRALLRERFAGAIAATVLLTTPRFVHQARRAQLDVLLTLFELATMWAYWRIDSDAARRDDPDRRLLALLHGATGLALLTKGPVGALPWLVIALHRVWDGRGRSLRALFPAWGIALAIGPIGAWLAAAVTLAPAGYFGDAVLDNVLARFFAGTDHVRPFTYYLTQLPVDALPWSPIAVAGGVLAWRRLGAGPARDRSAARLLLAWAAVFVVFFSFSAGKRGLYMLPLLPGIALLSALALGHWLEAGGLPRTVRLGGATVLGVVGLGGAWLAWGAPGGPEVLAATPVPSGVGWLVAAIGSLCVLGMTIGTGARRRRAATALASFAVALLALETVLFAIVFPALNAEKSPRPLAEHVAAIAPTHERVGVYRHGAFGGGLEYYSGRRVSVLETEEDVRRFVADGHRLVVVRERDRADLASRDGARLRTSARSGRRRLLVVELLDEREDADPSAPERSQPETTGHRGRPAG